MGNQASSEEIKAVLQKENVTLLDVRSAEEIAAQPLQSSREFLHIPVGSVGAKAKEAIPDQDGMYCNDFLPFVHRIFSHYVYSTRMNLCSKKIGFFFSFFSKFIWWSFVEVETGHQQQSVFFKN